jgi:hypothetical protein
VPLLVAFIEFAGLIRPERHDFKEDLFMAGAQHIPRVTCLSRLDR